MVCDSRQSRVHPKLTVSGGLRYPCGVRRDEVPDIRLWCYSLGTRKCTKRARGYGNSVGVPASPGVARSCPELRSNSQGTPQAFPFPGVPWSSLEFPGVARSCVVTPKERRRRSRSLEFPGVAWSCPELRSNSQGTPQAFPVTIPRNEPVRVAFGVPAFPGVTE